MRSKACNGGGPRRYMACANAAVLVERDDAYLQKLHDAGVRGARFTRGGLGISLTRGRAGDAPSRAIKELGWYVKVQPEANGIAEQLADLRSPRRAGAARPHGPRRSVRGRRRPEPRAHARAVQAWQLLGDAVACPKSSRRPARRGTTWCRWRTRLIEAAPDRCVWGSDWPHPVSVKQPPNEGELLELLYRFAPDAATLHEDPRRQPRPPLRIRDP